MSTSCSLDIGVISSFGMPESITIATSQFNDRTMQSNVEVNHLLQMNCSASITYHATSNYDQKLSTMEAFSIGQEYGKNLNIPVILSYFSSTTAVITNPIFNSFDVLQISHISTATVLKNFDAFFRSIPSDDIQAQAAINLCTFFGWKEIAVIHTMDTYGIGFAQSMLSHSAASFIDIQTFGFIFDDEITVENALKALKKSRRNIIFHVGFVGDLLSYNNKLKEFNLHTYPYFSVFIEMDLFSFWYSTSIIQERQIGSIGTCVWSPILIEKYPQIQKQYPFNETLKHFIRYASKISSSASSYDLFGYDNTNVLLIAIDKYIEKYGSDHFIYYDFNASNNESLSQFSARFMDILKNDISFIGLTGNVTFDQNGDRRNGLFSYCNFLEDGTMDYIGYSQSGSAFIPEEALANINWPKSFQERGIIPQWEYIEYNGISTTLVYAVWSIMAVSVCISFFYIMALFEHRKRPIIRSSQWKLSIVMCVGCCVSFVMVCVVGMDENNIIEHHSSKWPLICNIRIFLICFAFLLTFGPLFAKVYRIRKIFSYGQRLTKVHVVSDIKSIFLLLLWMIIDAIIICTIYFGFDFQMDREYIEGDENIAIEMWGVCNSPNDMQASLRWVLIILVFLPKLLFVIYLMVLSTMVYNTVSLMGFNEGLQILSAAVIAAVLIIIASLVLSLQTLDSQATVNFSFAFFSFIILVISHFCMGFMILPRLLAIWKEHDSEYMTANKKVEKRTVFYIQQFQRELKRKFSSSSSVQDTKTSSNTENEVEQQRQVLNSVGQECNHNTLNVDVSDLQSS